jgi:hypothetical protein
MGVNMTYSGETPRETRRMKNAQDDRNRLTEIRGEVKELMEEALKIASKHGQENVATSYWYAHVICALDRNNDYLGASMMTMEDSEDSIQSDIDDEEEEE